MPLILTLFRESHEDCRKLKASNKNLVQDTIIPCLKKQSNKQMTTTKDQSKNQVFSPDYLPL